MPARRLLVRKIREVLRLKHEHGLSHRAIARACAVGVGTVTLYLQRTVQEGLGWPLPAELDDAALEARLFRREAPVHDRVRPDRAYRRPHGRVNVAKSTWPWCPAGVSNRTTGSGSSRGRTART